MSSRSSSARFVATRLQPRGRAGGDVMKRIGLSIAIVCVCARGIGAAQDKQERPVKSDDKKVVLTGCLQAKNPNATADANAAYILTNASASDDTSSAAGSPSASSAPRPVIGKS